MNNNKRKSARKKYRNILIIINIIVAASLLLACLCCFVNPQTIWWLNFFGLAYLFFFTVNIFFLVIWTLSRKWKFMMINLVAILFGCFFIGRNLQLFEKEISEGILDKGYKILSFNVEGFNRINSVQPGGDILNMK